MRRVLLTEMRRGEAGKVALLAGAAGVWYLLSADVAVSDWIGWWNQASIKVQVFGVIVMGSLMSATAAWTAGRARRTRVDAWSDTAPRGGWSQALLLWAAAWLWSLLVYAVMAAVAFQRTAAVSEVTAPVWSPLVLGAAMTGLQIAAGVCAGTLLPSRITAPAMGVLWYLVFVVLAFLPGLSLARLFPALDEHWDATFQPHTARLLVAALWCAAAALAVLALPALLRRPVFSPGPLAAVPAVLALAAGGVLLTVRAPVGEPFWAVRAEQPAAPVCATEGRVRACLWPDDRHLLPQARDAARAVDRAVGALPGFRRDFRQTGLRPAGPDSAELPVYRPVLDSATMTEAMLGSALPPRPEGCAPHMLRETGGYPDAFLVEAVVNSRAKLVTPYYGDQFAAVLERVLATPAADQDRWLSAAADAIGRCRPVPAPPR
ncbi:MULTISPECIES: hypothetical protein [Streptomyces]|uniref:DUF7224 domain-containing protein n=1 Tax=Streptomyces lichenis TaxID=2306967 RepID=A0ABT0I747_9ACTN|nr:hypothetical protein [Streptomyces lichenis]MCK8677131.1 hypothetical protein [Streptomyces lichenis]